MKNLWAIFLLFSLTFPAFAEQGRYGAQVNVEKQVVNLPQDENKFYLTVFAKPDEAAKLGGLFNQPELVGYKQVTHFNVITTNDPIYKTRFAKVPAPTVRLQTAKGQIVGEYQGVVLEHPTLLAGAMKVDCWRKCRPGPESDPEPAIEPAPEPDPEPAKVQPDDSLAAGLAAASAFYVLAFVGGFAGGVASAKKNSK